MMADVTWVLALFCVAGCHLAAASPVLRSARVVQVGLNVTLTCNLTSGDAITWYLLRSDEVLPLLTVTFGGLKRAGITSFHTAEQSRFSSQGHVDNGGIRLEILAVQEKDAGLYFCTGSCPGSVCVNKAIHLVIGGLDREASRQPCWSLGICVLPASFVLCVIVVIGLYLCSGKPAACCCNSLTNTGVRVSEDESLHYSSLKHPAKPRPSGRGGTGLVKEEVTYSTVASHKNPNGLRNHR